MARKTHVQRPSLQFTKPSTPFRDASLCFIACEGSKTEAQYFAFSFLQHARVKLEVIPSENGCSAPVYVLDGLKKAVKKYKLQKGDTLWLVIDRDRWPYPNQIKEVIHKKIQKKPIQLVVSSPCFELWLYLHFAEMPLEGIPKSKEIEPMIRKLLGSYNKANLQEDDYREHVRFAIEQSEKSRIGSDELPINPGTTVHVLMKTILAMKPKAVCKVLP
ncbi:MAG TPA: RloB domain-containing protein [Spirochaetales bacterium]|nr:RloB domain-containing protein [Spirochaetales bacterium]